MAQAESGDRAYIVYRAIAQGTRSVEVHLVMAASAATVADAWARLSWLDPKVDPRSLEIETWTLPRRPAPLPAAAASHPIEIAHWLAARAAMPHDGGHEGEHRNRVHS